MAGREATAKAAAWANWLLDPTTKFEKLYLGLREDKAGGKESWPGSTTVRTGFDRVWPDLTGFDNHLAVFSCRPVRV